MRLLVFGNSGAGKSTFATHLASQFSLAHLDLDTVAWEATTPPVRRALDCSAKELAQFTRTHPTWVIEGCYSDLLALLLIQTTGIYFLDLSVDRCQHQARQRPWEPHKYPSKASQDANLPMLLDWIAEYEVRQDTFSRTAHESLFKRFAGEKFRLTQPPELDK